MRASLLLALAASLSSTYAQIKGFNYGSTQTDGSIKSETDFENEFKTAQNLVGAPGFTSARLYTMIQGGTTADPTAAIQAAINTQTTLLLGIWCSGGSGLVNNEITALMTAIKTYGTAFTSLVQGISVGSEDLYRISPTGLAAPDAAPGADPDTIVSYIQQVRSSLSGTPLSGAKVGHVDTWTAWVNGSNAAVINACDFIGMDAYPYFQNTMNNAIDQNYALFEAAYDATVAAAGGKDVWVTETGFPVSGKQSGGAIPSLQNAQTYWDEVGCGRLFGKVNTYWFTLQDAYPITPNPSFGIVGSTLSTTPLFDLSCAGVASPSVAASSSPSATSAHASTPVSSSGSSSGSGSGSGSGSSSAGTVPTGVSGGLSPSIGGGNGVVSSVITATTAAPVASSVATISAGGSNATIVTSIVPGNGSGSSSSPKPSTTSTGPASISSSGAGVGSTGSIVGAIGAIVALLAAL